MKFLAKIIFRIDFFVKNNSLLEILKQLSEKINDFLFKVKARSNKFNKTIINKVGIIQPNNKLNNQVMLFDEVTRK